ncbi:MAG: 2OG-Fe(II) oxygenase [Verrucomicrobiota bacterium]
MADDSIRIEYNQDLQPLEELLESVDRPGDFFVSGSAEIPIPKVEVDDVGTLSFPVPDTQIQQLVQHATRAPYGRGEQTILDESVRKVWQLPPERVRIGSKSWAANFDGILKQVVAGLGCEGMSVSAELYKLLVYDTGGFFLVHRDTEKAEGMFGTLVIVLPSAHRGGELVIRHAGREATVDMSGEETSEVKFAAFYADCEHEVRPITEGNRLCLVYNLIQQRDTRTKDQTLEAPDYRRQMTAAVKLLETHFSRPGAPAKIAWLLEHQYSPDGLTFAGLKSVDAARIRLLVQAAERAGCAAHLGIVHIEESGSANPTYYEYRPRRWRRYRDDDEEDEETGDTSSDNFEIIEVCDWRHYVSQWRNLHDQSVEFGEIPLEPGELLPDGALDDEKPDAQRLMEASGNEGASFERSYHRAALVLWRRDRYAEVLLQAGVVAALPLLKERIEACGAENAPRSAHKDAVALARQMVNAWKAAPELGWRQSARPDKRDGMLTLLARLGDTTLLAKFVADVVLREYDGSDNAALVACATALGAKQSGELYANLVCRHMQHLHGHCVDLLCAFAASNEAKGQAEWRSALRRIGEGIVGKLGEIGRQRRDQWVDWRIADKARPVDHALVANLLNALADLEALALRAAAVEAFAARPTVFDPVTVLVPALASLRAWDGAAVNLWAHSATYLLQRSSRPPEAPRDWRQDVKLSCSCADCRELQKFTLDPEAQVARFRVRQDRRQHLHQMIEKHDLDMTHMTERKGSPQTLVCTKNRRSYQRRCEQYRKDIAALASLSQLIREEIGSEELLKRIETARSLANRWSPA